MPEMDTTGTILSVVVGFLGLLGAILGFAAEGLNPSSAAAGLGIGASIFLLGGQITVSAVGGCFGCCKSRAVPSETKRVVGVVCGIFSWIVAAVALVLFLGVGIFAAGTFASGGVLTLISTALCITSFIMLRSEPVVLDATIKVQHRDVVPQQQPAMVFMTTGQPQMPTTESPNNPGEQQRRSAAGAMSHLLPDQSSPTPASGAPNRQGETPPPVYTGHPPSQMAAVVQNTQNKPTMQMQPPHYVMAADAQQLQQPVYVMQAPPQQYPVQAHGSDEQPLLGRSTLAQAQQQSSTPQVLYVLQQQAQQQYSVPAQVCVDMPVPPIAASLPQGFVDQAKPQTGITKNDLINVGVKIGTKVLVEAVKQSLSADNTGDAGATYSADTGY